MVTSRFTLYSGPRSMFGAKAQIAALEKGIDFELVIVQFDFHALYAPKHPQVLRFNPKRQVPVLVDGDLELFDSTQMFEYFEDLQPEPALWPHDMRERARARLLELQADEVYFPHIIKLMSLQDQLQGEAAQTAIEAAQQFCLNMEAQLADGRDWLMRDYTFADIAFFMAALFDERQGATLTPATPRLIARCERMTQRPAVAKVAGPMTRWLHDAGRPIPPFMQLWLGGA
ncbi:MAG: glutathione S-transferase family protein [Ramlibacter sp.]|nr:glutathione S-transferase family protein [Ramlibacter sp.]